MEYKYVVLGSGSNIVSWKPGTNCTLQELQEAPPGAKVLVVDSWDNSSRVVQVQTECIIATEDKVRSGQGGQQDRLFDRVHCGRPHSILRGVSNIAILYCVAV